MGRFTFFKLHNDLAHFLRRVGEGNLKGPWRAEGGLVVKTLHLWPGGLHWACCHGRCAPSQPLSSPPSRTHTVPSSYLLLCLPRRLTSAQVLFLLPPISQIVCIDLVEGEGEDED